MNSEAIQTLMQLRKAKEEVEKLEKEYRTLCECNEKLDWVKFKPESYQQTHKVCNYHEIRYYHNA
jgi:hypothetical protein